MAIENNGPQLTAGIDLNTAKAESQLQKMNASLSKLLGDFKHAQETLHAGIEKNAQQAARSLDMLSRKQQSFLRQYSQGGVKGNIRDAEAQRQINELNKSQDGVQAKITEATLRHTTRLMKTQADIVTARIKQESDRLDRMVRAATDDVRRATSTRSMYNEQRLVSQYNNPEYMAAKQRADERARQSVIDRDRNYQQYGQATVPVQQRGLFDSVNDRFNSNGGADIMAIQARLMAGYQALNLFFSAVRSGSQFILELDAELKQFQAITATSSAEMIGFKDQLIEVAQTSKFTAVELAQAATTMGQAGLSAREVGDSLQAVATLAAGSGSSLADSVDVVTSAVSIFNLQTQNTVDIANTMTAALNESKLSIDKINLGLQYAGNIAAETGVGYKELLAVLGTMSNAGIKSGSTLGTGFRQLLIDIQNPTEKFEKALRHVGLTTEDVNIKTKGFVGVLKTLHDAGFGTAQAFESFEVRAASAFAALDGNLDSVTEMQESFSNTTAAIEANNIQMESLQNKLNRLGSNAGIALDTAFQPVLEILKDIVDGLSEIFKILTEYPKVLQTIGTLVAAIAGMVAFGTAIAAVRGLSAAFLGMAGIVKGAEVAMLGFNIAVRANPILLLGTALVTGAVLMSQWGDKTRDTAAYMDELQGTVNKLKGDVDSTTQTLRSITDVTQQLIDQRQMLDSDPILRKAKITEVIDSFNELSTSIDASTSSVTDLLREMNKLRDTNVAIQGKQLQSQLDAQKALLATSKGDLNAYQTTGIGDVLRQREYSIGVRSDLMRNDAFNTGSRDRQQQMIIDAMKNLVPDSMGFDNLFDIASGKSAIPSLPELKLQAEGLKKTLDGMRDDGSGTVNALQGLSVILDEILVKQATVTKYNNEVKKLTDQLGYNSVLQNPAFKGLFAQAQSVTARASDERGRILSGTSGLTNEGRVTALNEQANLLRAEIDKMTADAEAAGADIAAAFRKDVLPAMESVETGMRSTLEKMADKLFKERERIFKQADQVTSEGVQSIAKKMGNAKKLEDTKVLRDDFMRLMDTRRRGLREMYNLKIEVTTDDEEAQKLRDELTKEIKKTFQDEVQFMEGLKSRQEQIQTDLLRSQQQTIEDQIGALNTKISENVEAMKKLNPGPAFDLLKRNTENMINELSRLSQQSYGLNMQIQNPAQFAVTGNLKAAPTSASENERISQVMALYMQAGYSKEQAAGVLGNFLQESRVRADGPLGDGGKAYGLAQWHPDRQARLQEWLADPKLNTTGAVNDLNGQGLFSIYELQKYYPKVNELLKASTSVEEATKAFAGYEGFKDWNKPTLYAAKEYQERTSNALGAYNVSAESLAKVDAMRTDVNNAAAPGVGRVTDAIVKAAEEQLKTQLQQAKLGGDPSKILAMQDTIDKEYDEIIKQRTEEFKKVNGRAPTEADTEFNSQMAEINSEQLAKTSTLIDTYWNAVQQKGEDAVKAAQLKLDEAQKPENAAKYTSAEIGKMEADVTAAQKIAQQQQLAAATQLAARANSEAAMAAQQYGANSEQVRYWTEQEAQAKQRAAEVTMQKNAADAATAKQGPSVAQAIKSANEQWAIQNGLMQKLPGQAATMVPLAQQVGAKWQEALTGIADNLATLFTNLASGTMSAKEALKQFALSTIQMFIQMISKALAYQLIMSTIGKSSSGGGLLTGLLGVPGMALGGEIPGVRGAAGGEMITGGIPNRDSVLRKLMPGEVVLRKSAVSQLGRNNVRNMNAMGNRRLSVDSNPFADPNQNGEGGNTVNVWVISPDQKPQMGPNDVVAIISDNIDRRGPLKQKIKEIQMGR